MSYNFSNFKTKVADVETWLKKEYSQIRTGRASPALLDAIRVDSYGALVPLNQIGSVTSEDARSIRVTPWDMSQAKAVEKAIMVANLGVSVGLDDRGVRVTFPELSTETRQSIVKLAKEKMEHARVTLRQDREKVWNDIQAKEKDGEVTEDDNSRLKNEMQKIVDDVSKKTRRVLFKKGKGNNELILIYL